MKRGSRKCTVCAHPKRHAVEVALAYGIPCVQIAERYPPLHWKAVWRHGRNHLPAQMRAAILTAQKPSQVDLERLQRSESEGLLASLVAQRARLLKQSEVALQMGSPSVAISAEQAIMSNLSLVGKLLGSLVQVHEVRNVSLLISPDYLRLRQRLIDALRPFPEAAMAVGLALHELETEAAGQIKADAARGKRPLLIEHEAEASAC